MDFTPEIEVTEVSVKQHVKYFRFRSRIQLGRPVRTCRSRRIAGVEVRSITMAHLPRAPRVGFHTFFSLLASVSVQGNDLARSYVVPQRGCGVGIG